MADTMKVMYNSPPDGYEDGPELDLSPDIWPEEPHVTREGTPE